MRGIGRGQRITVFIIPEVIELMSRELSDKRLGQAGAETAAVSRAGEQASPHEGTLRDIAGWLSINSMISEQIQWQMLSIQNTANIYRKNAFGQLQEPYDDATQALHGAAADERPASLTDQAEALVAAKIKCLDVFDEPIDFSLNAAVAEPVPLKDKLSGMLDANAGFVLTAAEHASGEAILSEVGYYSLLEGGGSGQRLETEQEREQEQEQQKEVQQQKDQEIEIEKFVDRDYSRTYTRNPAVACGVPVSIIHL